MKYSIVLTVVAVLAAACAAPGPVASDSSSTAAPPSQTMADRISETTLDFGPWTAYRTFNFSSTAIDVSMSDMTKIDEIVAYLKINSSIDVGVDGTLAPDSSEADLRLSSRRVAAIRRALMNAGGGIASYKIFIGAFADPGHRRVGQIQVLVGPRTGSLTAAPLSHPTSAR